MYEIRDATFSGSANVRANVSYRDGMVRLKLPVIPYDAQKAIVSWWFQVTNTLEKLQLPLECEKDETWANRLEIGRRDGGGWHFSASERAVAGEAYARVGPLYEYVTMSTQLADRASQCYGLGAALAVQRDLPHPKIIEKYEKLNEASLQLVIRYSSSEGAALHRRLAAAGLPSTSSTVSVSRLCEALSDLLKQMLQLAAEEYDGWEATRPQVKKRFRSPTTLSLVKAALSLAEEQLSASRIVENLVFSVDLEERLKECREKERVLVECVRTMGRDMNEALDDGV